MSLKESRKNAVKEGCAKIIRRCHRAPSLFRACKNKFQLSQAIRELCGNRLIQKENMLRVVRNPEAGDFCAPQTRLLCWTSPCAIRNKGDAKASQHATGTGRLNASGRHHSDAATTRRSGPRELRLTRVHNASPDQVQKQRRGRAADPRFGGGKKGLLPAVLYPSSNPEMELMLRSHLRSSDKPSVL